MTPVERGLRAVTEETLEQIAFAPVMPSDQPFDWAAPDLVWASLALKVALHGELVCAASATTLHALAADAWGADEGEAGAEAFLLEAANVIGGRLLATLYPDVAPVLGLPVAGGGPRAPSPGALVLALAVESGRLGVSLEVDAADDAAAIGGAA